MWETWKAHSHDYFCTSNHLFIMVISTCFFFFLSFDLFVNNDLADINHCYRVTISQCRSISVINVIVGNGITLHNRTQANSTFHTVEGSMSFVPAECFPLLRMYLPSIILLFCCTDITRSI